MELRRGEYDVLHCHHDIVSAVYLLAALGMRIRRRIVHVHNADEAVLTPSRLKQRIYREPMRQVCLSMADRIVGISNHTLDTFLAGRARRPGRDLVHYYGLDPTPFENVAADRVGFRRQLDLPEDARILLFAGRLVPEKNPVFAVDVLANLRRIEARAVAVFAGAGSEEMDVLARARELGVENSSTPSWLAKRSARDYELQRLVHPSPPGAPGGGIRTGRRRSAVGRPTDASITWHSR